MKYIYMKFKAELADVIQAVLNLIIIFSQTGPTLQYGGGALGASLSPPYSNHSPTHSNQTTSPHAYIGNYMLII